MPPCRDLEDGSKTLCISSGGIGITFNAAHPNFNNDVGTRGIDFACRILALLKDSTLLSTSRLSWHTKTHNACKATDNRIHLPSPNVRASVIHIFRFRTENCRAIMTLCDKILLWLVPQQSGFFRFFCIYFTTACDCLRIGRPGLRNIHLQLGFEGCLAWSEIVGVQQRGKQ